MEWIQILNSVGIVLITVWLVRLRSEARSYVNYSIRRIGMIQEAREEEFDRFKKYLHTTKESLMQQLEYREPRKVPVCIQCKFFNAQKSTCTRLDVGPDSIVHGHMPRHPKAEHERSDAWKELEDKYGDHCGYFGKHFEPKTNKLTL